MTHEEKQVHNAVEAELKEYEEFKMLVNRVREMREAQWAFDMITGEEDIEYIDMMQIAKREAEREVDEYLKEMEEEK